MAGHRKPKPKRPAKFGGKQAMPFGKKPAKKKKGK